MDVQNRIASVPTGRIAFAAALVLGLAVVVLMSFAGPARTAQPFPTTAPQVIASPEHPDAQDRNSAYNQASAAKWRNQSPDAEERNGYLAK